MLTRCYSEEERSTRGSEDILWGSKISRPNSPFTISKLNASIKSLSMSDDMSTFITERLALLKVERFQCPFRAPVTGRGSYIFECLIDIQSNYRPECLNVFDLVELSLIHYDRDPQWPDEDDAIRSGQNSSVCFS